MFSLFLTIIILPRNVDFSITDLPSNGLLFREQSMVIWRGKGEISLKTFKKQLSPTFAKPREKVSGQTSY